VTPAGLITGFITDKGMMDVDDVGEGSGRHGGKAVGR
jgi:hypothetical protein